jgi:hypothetical protein
MPANAVDSGRRTARKQSQQSPWRYERTSCSALPCTDGAYCAQSRSRRHPFLASSLLVGAGRFDGHLSQGRLLMHDRHDFRDLRICHPAAWRRQATRSCAALGNWWETVLAGLLCFRG